jgi:hypothetical protein
MITNLLIRDRLGGLWAEAEREDVIEAIVWKSVVARDRRALLERYSFMGPMESCQTKGAKRGVCGKCRIVERGVHVAADEDGAWTALAVKCEHLLRMRQELTRGFTPHCDVSREFAQVAFQVQ